MMSWHLTMERRVQIKLWLKVVSCLPFVKLFVLVGSKQRVATVYEYVHNSTVMDQTAGKVCAGWTVRNGERQGGCIVPPSLDDIWTEKEYLQLFVSKLFRFDTERNWSHDMRNHLVASLLRWYPQFLAFIESLPDKRYRKSILLFQRWQWAPRPLV